MLGGYRLVRKLGSGSRAEVWLGSDGSSTAAIKVFRPDTAQASIDAEIDALGLARSRHVVRLDDLASGPHGMPCLILQRVSSLSLGRLLANRYPTPGESVTILAPLALALAELHRVGVAHGAIAPAAVLFDDSGAPVLTGFGSAELFGELSADGSPARPTPAVLSKTESVAADLRGMVSLARSVLGSAGSDVAWWLEVGAEQAAPHEFLAELADRLFASAIPTSVSFGIHGVDPSRDAVLSRVEPARSLAPVLESPRDVETEPTDTQASGVFSLFHLPEAFLETARSILGGGLAPGGFAGLRERLAALLRPVRTPVWIVAGLVAVAIIAFTALVPTKDHHEASAALATPAPTYSPSSAASRANPSIRGDDPISAGQALLSARAECFAAESVLCLDGVDQPNSAAMDADSNQIRLQQAGGVAADPAGLMTALAAGSTDGPRLTLVERLGDSALLTIDDGTTKSSTPSVTMLIVRGQEGWRIRDLVVSDPAAP